SGAQSSGRHARRTAPVGRRMAAAQPCALISSSTFQKDGLLVIVFDEAETSDSTDGGGHVAALIVSPKAKQGHQSKALYQHQSTLRLILQGLGIQTYPAAASTAPDMGEFF